jgi:hypothetical protein
MERVKEFFEAINETFTPVDIKGSLVPHNLMFVDGEFTIMIYRVVGENVLGYPIRLAEEDFDGWRVEEMIAKLKYAVDEHCIGYVLQLAKDQQGKITVTRQGEE